ncbi:MAG TPA: dicarboxylate/amino acid:cation symporter, partial [Candidatus Synoicihabitans sp.]|nr:dicarboxylate/amino acid:cation symporter [Candidatus Synoicihabitans sp.]
RFSTTVLDPFGQVFLRLLFFVVVPLVFASLASGVAQLGNLSKLGPLAGRTFGLFFANMAIGVTLGLLMMTVIEPGNRLDPAAKESLMLEYGGDAAKHVATSTTQPKLTFAVIVDMFMPRNLFGAVSGTTRNALGEVLPLIVFAILLGAVATQLPESRRLQVQHALDLLTDLMTGIVNFALRLAPYAVPAMIFSVVVKIGLGIVLALAVFVLGCLGVMALHLFGSMSVFLRVLSRHRPRQFFRDIRPVLVTAFSTSSSNATMPTAIALARDTLKVSPSTSGFVIPLGATMNMSGTALYEGCVVLFVAQVFGVDLSLGQQVTLLLLAVISAVAVAGIPGGSLPLIAGLLATFGIPPEGIGIILGIDRILDMARTTVNVGCDVVTTVIVDDMVRGDGPPPDSGNPQAA